MSCSRLAVAVAALIAFLPSSASASSGGIGSTNCNSCHSGGPGGTTANAVFTGPYILGQPVSVTVSVGSSLSYAGFNLTVTGASGTFSNLAATGAWEIAPRSVTHTAPRFGRTWTFTYTPSATGTVNWTLWGNAVNLNMSSLGDSPIGSAVSGSFNVTLGNGSVCTADSQCNSGGCVHSDGADCGGRGGCVCCNQTTCVGACLTCTRASNLGTCGAEAAGVSCRTASCTGAPGNTVATASATCNGSSTSCPAAVTDDCSPYMNCNGTVCDTACASGTECEATYFCNGSSQCQAVSNECVQNLDDCVAIATCSDPTTAVGDFMCMCPMGYSGNGRASGTGCSDINECTLNLDNCSANATCTNTPLGSFTCTCNSGYSGDGVSCNNINECNDPRFSSQCDPNAMCQDRIGSWTCVCNSGFRGNGFTCTDIDECAEGRDNCDVNAACNDYDGGFACACNMGWMGNGVTCSDIDECDDPMMTSRCSSASMCENLPGDWRCNCNPGYRGDGFTCDDIDECMEGSHDCDANAMCMNTNGSWICTCNAGYEGSGVSCTDINECTRGTHGCRTGEICVDQEGAPNTCECAPGYSRPSGGGSCSIVCGDAQRGPGEGCDDANLAGGDGCSTSCAIEDGWACIEPPFGMSTCSNSCGDGLIDAPFEDCDDGPSNSDTTPDACRTNCGAAGCGDGVLDGGEDCDDGDDNSDTDADACRTTCAPAFCGDGVIDSGEMCDPGGGSAPADACTTMCGSADAGVVEPPMDGGCGCRTVSRRDATPMWLLLALVAILLGRRRRAR